MPMFDMVCPCGSRFVTTTHVRDWDKCDVCGATAKPDPDAVYTLAGINCRQDPPSSVFTPAVLKDLAANKRHYEKLHDQGDLHNGKRDIVVPRGAPDAPDRPPKFY